MADVYFIPDPELSEQGLVIKDVAEASVAGDWVALDLENGDHIGILVGTKFVGYKILQHGYEGGGGRPRDVPSDELEDAPTSAKVIRLH